MDVIWNNACVPLLEEQILWHNQLRDSGAMFPGSCTAKTRTEKQLFAYFAAKPPETGFLDDQQIPLVETWEKTKQHTFHSRRVPCLLGWLYISDIFGKLF